MQRRGPDDADGDGAEVLQQPDAVHQQVQSALSEAGARRKENERNLLLIFFVFQLRKYFDVNKDDIV